MDFISIPNTDLRTGMTIIDSGDARLIYYAEVAEHAPLINGRRPVVVSFGGSRDREFLDARGVTYVKGGVHELPLGEEDVLLTLKPTIDRLPGDEKSEPDKMGWQAPSDPFEVPDEAEPDIATLPENVQPLKPTAPKFTPRSFPAFPEVTAMRGGLSFSDPYAHLTREQLIERLQDRAATAAKALRKVRKLKETRRRLRRIIEGGRS